MNYGAQYDHPTPVQRLIDTEPDRFDVAAFLAATRPAWMAQATCTDAPRGMFFPKSFDDQRPAKAICAGCPVRETCLRFAIDNDLPNGIRGGLNEQERTRYRKRGSSGKPIAHGTYAGAQAHRRLHEAMCDECRAANNAYQRATRRPRTEAVAS